MLIKLPIKLFYKKQTMYEVIPVITPIFSLIFSGYILRKRKLLCEGISHTLNNYVIILALPALLFKVTATSPIQTLWKPEFIFSIIISCFSVFIFIQTIYLIKKESLIDSTIKSLSASYSNTGFMGFSVCFFIFGEEGIAPALIATLIIACFLYSLSIILVETSTTTNSNIYKRIFFIFNSTIKNPLIFTPLLGFYFSVSEIIIPAPILVYLTSLGDSATPCALVSIGAFLARKQETKREKIHVIILCKLILQPLITWFFVFKVFSLPLLWCNAAILLSALPTGTGPYMLVNYYSKDAGLVSRVILITTILSLFSITLCVFLINKSWFLLPQ